VTDDGWMDLCPQGGLEPDEARRIYAIIEAAVAQAESLYRWTWDGTKGVMLEYRKRCIETCQAVEAWEKEKG